MGAMALYRSTGPTRLVFAGITNPATGRTLVLDPGGEVDLKDDPGHPLLVPAKDDKGGQAPAADEATAAEVDALKGKALDDALRDAGLPVKGTAPEKRQALVAHLSGS